MSGVREMLESWKRSPEAGMPPELENLLTEYEFADERLAGCSRELDTVREALSEYLGYASGGVETDDVEDRTVLDLARETGVVLGGAARGQSLPPDTEFYAMGVNRWAVYAGALSSVLRGVVAASQESPEALSTAADKAREVLERARDEDFERVLEEKATMLRVLETGALPRRLRDALLAVRYAKRFAGRYNAGRENLSEADALVDMCGRVLDGQDLSSTISRTVGE